MKAIYTQETAAAMIEELARANAGELLRVAAFNKSRRQRLAYQDDARQYERIADTTEEVPPELMAEFTALINRLGGGSGLVELWAHIVLMRRYDTAEEFFHEMLAREEWWYARLAERAEEEAGKKAAEAVLDAPAAK